MRRPSAAPPLLWPLPSCAHGFHAQSVTSLAAELGGVAPAMEVVAAEVAAAFAEHFGFAAEAMTDV